MMYVVVDTNVLVSALLSKHSDASTVVIREYILQGKITPLYNDEIFKEYTEVLHRPKLHLPAESVDAILAVIAERGLVIGRTKSNEVFPDPKDVVFYEVALSKEGSRLVTGNTKHFPKSPIVVTPAELLELIKSIA